MSTVYKVLKNIDEIFKKGKMRGCGKKVGMRDMKLQELNLKYLNLASPFAVSLGLNIGGIIPLEISCSSCGCGLKDHNGSLICEVCGERSKQTSYSHSFLDSKRVSIPTKCCQRQTKIMECLKRFKGEGEIPETVLNKIKNQLLFIGVDPKKSSKEEIVCAINRKNLTKYLKNVNTIFTKITGKTGKRLTTRDENFILNELNKIPNVKQLDYALFRLLRKEGFVVDRQDFSQGICEDVNVDRYFRNL